MTVYVDDMRVPFGRWLMCHMIADTARELHEMAAAIGVGPRWFHRGDHYDINWTQRAEAVKRGAIEAPRRFVARRVAIMRGKGNKARHTL